MVKAILNRHFVLLKKYHGLTATFIFVCFVILYTGYVQNNMLHSVGYIVACWLAAFVTDWVTFGKSHSFIIKKNVRKEIQLLLVCTLLGITYLVFRLTFDWHALSKLVRLAMLPLILFAFPIFIAVYYLFKYKYKPSELGINLNYWYLPIFVHIIFGGITMLVAPEKSHWGGMLSMGGLFEMLLAGLIGAGLAEEFWRMLFQTRFAKLTGSIGWGFVIATMLWAFMHIPSFSQDHETVGFLPGIIASVRIALIGFLWGYITHRTGSLVPGIFIHGLNLWGLQNF